MELDGGVRGRSTQAPHKERDDAHGYSMPEEVVDGDSSLKDPDTSQNRNGHDRKGDGRIRNGEVDQHSPHEAQKGRN